MEINTVVQATALETTLAMPDECVDLVIVDPPYLTTREAWDQTEVFTQELVDELFRVMKPTASIYVWCGIGEKSQSLIRWFPFLQSKFVFKDLITWKKSRGIGMRKGWLYTREEIMWAVKDNKQFVWNKDAQYTTERRSRDKGKDVVIASQSGYYAKSLFKRITNVWTDISEESFDVTVKRLHYTPKPKLALTRIIAAHTAPGDLVYDCFMGSGATAKAAKSMNRDYYGCDIDLSVFSV